FPAQARPFCTRIKCSLDRLGNVLNVSLEKISQRMLMIMRWPDGNFSLPLHFFSSDEHRDLGNRRPGLLDGLFEFLALGRSRSVRKYRLISGDWHLEESFRHGVFDWLIMFCREDNDTWGMGKIRVQ